MKILQILFVSIDTFYYYIKKTYVSLCYCAIVLPINGNHMFFNTND